MSVTLTGVSSTGFVAGGYPGGPQTTQHYAANGVFDAGFYYTPFAYGYNLASVDDVGALDILPTGCKGLVYIGYSAGGADATFISLITPFIGNPKLYGFYLADQPDISNTWGTYYAPANLQAQSDWIHANVTGAITFIVLPNQGSAESPNYVVSGAAYTPANTDIDYFGINPYPVRNDVPGNFDPTIINGAVAAVITSGVPSNQIIPMYQAFGGGGFFPPWTLPTVAQTITSLQTWASLVPKPPFDYTFSWSVQSGDNALASSPNLQQVFLLENGPQQFLSLTLPDMGVAATGSAGTVGVSGSSLTTMLPSVTAVGSAGSTGTAISLIAPGASAAGQIGAVTATEALIAPVTGVSASGQIGSLQFVSQYFANALGIGASSQIGTLLQTVITTAGAVSASGQVGAPSQSVTIPTTGVSAAGQAGSVIIAGFTVIAVSGVSTTSQIGTMVTSEAILATSVSAAGQAGIVFVSNAVVVLILGVGALSQIGSMAKALSVAIAGIQASDQVGSLLVTTPGTVSGVSTASQIGTVSIAESFIAVATGVSAAGNSGIASATNQIAVTGTSASGQSGSATGTVVTTIPGRSGTGAAGITPEQMMITVPGTSGTGQVSITAAPTSLFVGGAASGQVAPLLVNLLSSLIPVASTVSTGLVATFAPGNIVGLAASGGTQSLLDEIDHALISVAAFGLAESPFAPVSSTEVFVMVMD